jgi:hypothetical protein
MTALLMPPVYVVLACDGLKFAYLPVQWIPAHRSQELGRCVHAP